MDRTLASSSSDFSRDTDHTNAPQKHSGRSKAHERGFPLVRKKERKHYLQRSWETTGPFHNWQEIGKTGPLSELHRERDQISLSTPGSFYFHSGDWAGLTAKTPLDKKQKQKTHLALTPAPPEPPLLPNQHPETSTAVSKLTEHTSFQQIKTLYKFG